MGRDRYITIQEWMIKGLHLHGNEAMCYAIIFGFSQDEESRFYGSLNFLADMLDLSKRQVINILSSLQEKGLVKKYEVERGRIKTYEYAIDFTGGEKISLGGENFSLGGEKISLGGENFSLGGEKISPNNKVDNKVDNILKKEINKERKTELSPAEKTAPSIDTKEKEEKRESSAKEKKELIFPFHSAEFMKWWQNLCDEPKWRGKTKRALQLNLNVLKDMSEEKAIESIKRTIMNGWQGVFHLSDGGRKDEGIDISPNAEWD